MAKVTMSNHYKNILNKIHDNLLELGLTVPLDIIQNYTIRLPVVSNEKYIQEITDRIFDDYFNDAVDKLMDRYILVGLDLPKDTVKEHVLKMWEYNKYAIQEILRSKL